jgi:hypothetical protein
MISRHGSQTNALPEVWVIGFEHRGQGMPAKRRSANRIPAANAILKGEVP